MTSISLYIWTNGGGVYKVYLDGTILTILVMLRVYLYPHKLDGTVPIPYVYFVSQFLFTYPPSGSSLKSSSLCIQQLSTL